MGSDIERLLEEDGLPEQRCCIHERRPRKLSSRSWAGLFAVVQVCLLIAYTSVFLITQRHYKVVDNSSWEMQISPASNAIRYERRYFEKQGHATSPFSGAPRPELEEAWHDLLSGMNIKVSEEYLTPYNATSVPLVGGGYVAQLGMYHELHCLKRIRHWLYKEHYLPNATEKELAKQENHIHHCLEWLRVVALCRGDTVLTTLEWDGDHLETEYPIPRQCVDSDHLLLWSQHHAVDLSGPGVFLKPGPDIE